MANESSTLVDNGTPANSRVSLALLTGAVVLFGMAYGADSFAAGNGILMPVIASTFIVGGASQIATEAVLRGDGSSVTAVLIGLALNLRFVALGLIISPYLPTQRVKRLFASHLVSDHPVSFSMLETPERRKRSYILIGLLMWGAWVGGTLIGAVAGSAFDAAAFGADGAIAAGFIALAVDQVAGRKSVITAIVAFATSMILMIWVESGIAVVGATVVAIVVGRAIGVHKELAR